MRTDTGRTPDIPSGLPAWMIRAYSPRNVDTIGTFQILFKGISIGFHTGFSSTGGLYSGRGWIGGGIGWINMTMMRYRVQHISFSFHEVGTDKSVVILYEALDARSVAAGHAHRRYRASYSFWHRSLHTQSLPLRPFRPHGAWSFFLQIQHSPSGNGGMPASTCVAFGMI